MRLFIDTGGLSVNYGLHEYQKVALAELAGFMEADSTFADVRHAGYLIATCFHETAHTFLPVSERGSRSYFNKYEPTQKLGRTLGNTIAGDGYTYRGRGYVQITGRYNYARFSSQLQVNLIGQPALACDPQIAYRIISFGMKNGFFTGRKLGDYLNEFRQDYFNARRVVNGIDRAEFIQNWAVRAVPFITVNNN